MNAVSLTLAVAYYIFHLIVTFRKTDKELKKAVKTVYKICVRTIKCFTLAVAIYGLWLSIDNLDPLTLILTMLSLVGWLLQVFLDIIMFVINRYAQFIKEAILADIEEIKKPVTTVSNFFKKMTGKEIEEKEVSKTRAKLDAMVSERKEEIKNLKAEAKERRRQEKEQQNEVAATESPNQEEGENEKPNILNFFNRFKKN